MSQFILIPISIENQEIISHLEFLSSINDESIKAASHLLNFRNHDFLIYTIRDIDRVCMAAQRALAEGGDIEDTDLFLILKDVTKITNEFFMWYGNDYHDLDVVHTEYELVENIVSSLKKSCGEIYIHYQFNLNKVLEKS